ncbi:energy transducer TonB [Psychrobium sp. 1_MG-2023]|nr:energy transducer TonB [Psychrobium sp. 1_MG-2023]
MKQICVLMVGIFGLCACASKNAVVPKGSINIADLDLKFKSVQIDLTSDKYKGDIDKYWQPVKKTIPSHPMSEETSRLSGCVEFLFVVDEKAKNIKISQAYPEGAFDHVATQTLKEWRWTPTRKNEQKLPALLKIQMDFVSDISENKLEAQQHCGWQHP